MHPPPDADVLRWLEPRHVAELVRLVEIENDVRRQVERAGTVCDQQRAPGRRERRDAFDFRTLRRRRQHRLEPRTVDATQPHARIVHQRRFVDRDVQTRIGADRERRVRLSDFAQRSPTIEIFVAIPLPARDPPRRALIGEGELGQLFADVHLVQLRLIRKLVAKPDAIVEYTEHDDERALRLTLLDQPSAQLVVAIAHVAPLTPRLLPCSSKLRV
jgi:hypothetical protein